MNEDEAKRDLMRRWLVKACHDLAAAGKLAGGPDVYLDVAIYHCQQAAEKALKALLVFHDQRFQKTHDLRVLVELARPFDATIDQCWIWLSASPLTRPPSVIPAKCWSRIPNASKRLWKRRT